MQFIGVIPARYASTRFPGKPLAMIGKKSMIRRVYERTLKSKKIDKAFVATDDKRIENHVKEFGNVIMTKTSHTSGTERCSEVAEKLIEQKESSHQDIIINIQGDEPFIDPIQIDQLANIMQNPDVKIATLAKKITSYDVLFNNNIVKVLLNKNLKAIYFSRAPLPHCRNLTTEKWLNNINFFCHIGLYGYKTNTLLEIVKLPQAMIEQAEALEQLRWMYNEYDIHVGITEKENYSVDIKEDINNIPKNLYSL